MAIKPIKWICNMEFLYLDTNYSRHVHRLGVNSHHKQQQHFHRQQNYARMEFLFLFGLRIKMAKLFMPISFHMKASCIFFFYYYIFWRFFSHSTKLQQNFVMFCEEIISNRKKLNLISICDIGLNDMKSILRKCTKKYFFGNIKETVRLECFAFRIVFVIYYGAARFTTQFTK